MRRFIAKHVLLSAAALFVVLFSLLHVWKPSLIYMADGRFRDFGVGYKHRSILTGWGAAIVLALFSYIVVKTAIRRP